jgi:hypothetical protein
MTRDLRDPEKLGKALLGVRANFYMNGFPPGGPTLSKSYDSYKNLDYVPDVSKDDSMGKQCVREYRAELESRAAEGDKYAASALESIDAGKGVQGYDEAGA